MACVSFVADDLAAWLVSLVADAGRKRLTSWLLGDEQERALRQAATAAVPILEIAIRDLEVEWRIYSRRSRVSRRITMSERVLCPG